MKLKFGFQSNLILPPKKARLASDCLREVPFSVGLAQVRLEGNIDLFCWNQDQATIVDYKTGRDQESSDAAAREAGYRLQAECYALAALSAGAREVDVYSLPVMIDRRTIHMKFGVMPSETADSLELANVQATLGYELLEHFAVSLAMEEGTVSLDPLH